MLVLCFAIYKISWHLGIWTERFFNHDKRLDKFDAMHDTLVALKERVDLMYENTVKNKLYESHSKEPSHVPGSKPSETSCKTSEA